MLAKMLLITLYTYGLLSSPALYAADELSAKEYEIKAAFLFHLGSFVSWPKNVLPSPTQTFQVCVVGNNPFGDNLDYLKQEYNIQKHAVTTLYFDTLHPKLKSCHILFIAKSLQTNLPSFLELLSQEPVLTVSDIRHFSKKGGMVEFIIRRKKVRLRLSPDTFKQANLKPSSDLLRIADSLD
jgi:hypothetical protein